MKEFNLIGELRIMKDLDIKPNISAIARKYGVDRHSVKKYYDNDGVPERKETSKKSKWDPFEDEIRELMQMEFVSKKSIFMFLLNEHKTLPGDYNSFKSYTWRKGITVKVDVKPHLLYEVEPGHQLQADWVENLTLHLKDGNSVNFNVFSATLGYSRYHLFIYSSTKTTEDFIRCSIEVFRRLGGVTKSFYTDNMSAVVSVRNNKKKIHANVSTFFKDMGCILNLAEIHTPQTKGKDENANKFIKWIYPYDYKLDCEEDIIKLIEKTITADCNRQINTGTGVPPIALFKNEKEYLKPLPHKILLDSYINEHYRQKVEPTLLVYCKGSRYSVPVAYIGKTVDIYPIENHIYIYCNSLLIAKHTISQKNINYNYNHYVEGMKKRLPYKEEDEIEIMSDRNLKLMDKMSKKRKEIDE
jgi:transposase